MRSATWPTWGCADSPARRADGAGPQRRNAAPRLGPVALVPEGLAGALRRGVRRTARVRPDRATSLVATDGRRGPQRHAGATVGGRPGRKRTRAVRPGSGEPGVAG